ncbi:hypothetical protein Dimus_024320 [Dionaea muscipula]
MTLIHLKKKDVVKSSVKGVAIEFDHLKSASILGIPRNNGICEYIKDVWEESKYIKPLEITRRFANDETLTTKKKIVIDKVAVQGESGSDDQFFDAQVDVEEPVTETPAAPALPGDSSTQQKEQTPVGVDPSGLSGHIPDSFFTPFQAEFERVRANRIQAELEKEQAENAILLALLQQAQSKPKP